MTTHCSYCTTVLCEGCSYKYTGKFFRGYKPQFYLTKVITNHTNPVKSWLSQGSK